jgi:hypothetical protein
MKNKLEDFVNRNREAFDSEMPAEDVWKDIDRQPVDRARPARKMFHFFTRTQLAASLLVIITGATIFLLLQKGPETPETATPVAKPAATEQAAVESTEPVSPESLDQITKMVEVKQAQLKEIEKSNPVLYKKFTVALDQLNDAYKELEKQLDINPNKEQLLEAMIQNLSLQQELLNQQLSIYQKIKQTNNEKVNKDM